MWKNKIQTCNEENDMSVCLPVYWSGMEWWWLSLYLIQNCQELNHYTVYNTIYDSLL